MVSAFGGTSRSVSCELSGFIAGACPRISPIPGAAILGCAGMARHRRPLEDALGVPVDPTQAAVAMALGTILAATV